MGGSVGVQGSFERSLVLVRNARVWWELGRRRRQAQRAARDALDARREGTIARHWVEAELAARSAVRAGVRGDDYLRARLARYAAALPLPLEAMGVGVTFEGGEPVIRARPRANPAGTAGPGPLSREVDEARAEVILASERVGSARSRLDALHQAVSEDLASGRLACDPGLLEASPEQRGRPPVPPLAPQLLLGGFSVALVASSGFRMAAPAFALAGLSADALAADLARDAAGTISALLFGLGAAVAVFAFLSLAADRGRELLEATAPARRPALVAVAGGAAVALSTAVALSAVRPGLLAGPLLLVTAPLGAVFLARQARSLAAARATAEAAALAWDREQARNAAERSRRGESLSRLESTLAAAQRELELAEQRLRQLEQRSADETRVHAALAARRTLSGERLAESLAAALELDRYAYVRRAAALAKGAADVRPLRTRPASIDPTVRGPLEAAG